MITRYVPDATARAVFPVPICDIPLSRRCNPKIHQELISSWRCTLFTAAAKTMRRRRSSIGRLCTVATVVIMYATHTRSRDSRVSNAFSVISAVLHDEQPKFDMFEFRSKAPDASSNLDTLGICITGQLCRLELSNKVEYLFKPSASMYSLHVVFALYETCEFTNAAQNMETQNYDAKELRGALDNHDIIRHSTLALLTPPRTIVHKRYIQSLDKQTEHMNQTHRAQSHYRHWYNYHICDKILEKSALYMRVREDVVFLHKFNPYAIQLAPRTIAVPACLSWWGGLNDKAAIIHPSIRYEFFNGPLIAYLMHFHVMRCKTTFFFMSFGCRYAFRILNPETYLLRVMEFYHIRTLRLEAVDFPVVTARKSESNKYGICFDNAPKQLGKDFKCVPKNVNGEHARLLRDLQSGQLYCP